MFASSLLQIARETILQEADYVRAMADLLTEDFERSVQAMHACKGRVVVSGIGKSAIIAQKIVATLNSTGTPSSFLHASEAIHGDLGMVQPDDVVIVISKSGNSPEIKVLAPIIKRFGNTLIGMTGNLTSFLAQQSDLILDTTVAREVCPNNLAPTSSTTAQLVMGDALAVCLVQLRQFGPEDFAKYHPGGALGKKLLMRVRDLLHSDACPAVQPHSSVREVIVEISEKRLGVTAVVDTEGHLTGIITDGDLRRMLAKGDDFTQLTAADIMTSKPKQVEPDDMVVDALNTMEDHSITQLLVSENGKYMGIIHLHDILKEGIV